MGQKLKHIKAQYEVSNKSGKVSQTEAKDLIKTLYQSGSIDDVQLEVLPPKTKSSKDNFWQQSSPLTVVGINFYGFGQELKENFVELLVKGRHNEKIFNKWYSRAAWLLEMPGENLILTWRD